MKKVMIICLIAVLLLITYIAVLWFMSLDSIMDKDGMVYKEYKNNSQVYELHNYTTR